MNLEAVRDLENVLEARTRGKFQGVVGTKKVVEADESAVWLEHERIPFVSYPYEWSPEMLHAAGRLTLDLAEEALTEGLGLKDATPYNLLFQGPHPIFVDLLSFEQRDPLNPTWLPQAQFERTFVNPLLAYKHLGIAVGQTLLARRDGLEPSELVRSLSLFRRFHPDFLGPVSIPHWLDQRKTSVQPGLYKPRLESSPDKARFILDATLRRCRKRLDHAKPAAKDSIWTNYMSTNSYEAVQFSAKEKFVQEALSSLPGWVLDVGCNTGHFSELAARSQAKVVAVDQDPAVVGYVWRRAVASGLDILPLVVDLARPTPAMGWRNLECESFLERATERFDLVLMLAVIHHMLVTERIPLDEILQEASRWTRKHVLIEFVAPGDSMFLRLTRGRDHLFHDLNEDTFEQACGCHFRILKKEKIPHSQRTLYLLSKEI